MTDLDDAPVAIRRRFPPELTRRMVRRIREDSLDTFERSLIEPTTAFTDPERFARERELIFRRGTHVVGYTGELPQPNTYVTKEVAGVPVLVQLTGAADPSSADLAAGLQYGFDLDGDGVFEIASPTPSATRTFMTGGTYTVRARVRDKDGGEGVYTTTVNVSLPAPPAASLTSGGPVDEGTAGSVSFGPASGAGPFTYSYDFDNDGTFEVAGTTSAAATVPAEYLADGMCAEVAGTDAAVSLFDKLMLHEPINQLVYQSAAHRRPEQWRASVDAYVAGRAGDLERLRAQDTHRTSLWHTHPPSGRRAQLLLAWPRHQPTVTLTPDDAAALDRDLSGWFAAVHRHVLGTREFHDRSRRSLG